MSGTDTLLFSPASEIALIAAVWALLWLPCYLGERRRALSAAVAAVAAGTAGGRRA